MVQLFQRNLLKTKISVRGKLKGATGVHYKRTRDLPTNSSFEENFRDNSVFQLAIA